MLGAFRLGRRCALHGLDRKLVFGSVSDGGGSPDHRRAGAEKNAVERAWQRMPSPVRIGGSASNILPANCSFPRSVKWTMSN